MNEPLRKVTTKSAIKSIIKIRASELREMHESKSSIFSRMNLNNTTKDDICREVLTTAGYTVGKNPKRKPCKIVNEIISLHLQYINDKAGTGIADIPEYKQISAVLFNCGTDKTLKSLHPTGDFDVIINNRHNPQSKIMRSNWCYQHDNTKPKLVKANSVDFLNDKKRQGGSKQLTF